MTRLEIIESLAALDLEYNEHSDKSTECINQADKLIAKAKYHNGEAKRCNDESRKLLDLFE